MSNATDTIAAQAQAKAQEVILAELIEQAIVVFDDTPVGDDRVHQVTKALVEYFEPPQLAILATWARDGESVQGLDNVQLAARVAAKLHVASEAAKAVERTTAWEGRPIRNEVAKKAMKARSKPDSPFRIEGLFAQHVDLSTTFSPELDVDFLELDDSADAVEGIREDERMADAQKVTGVLLDSGRMVLVYSERHETDTYTSTEGETKGLTFRVWDPREYMEIVDVRHGLDIIRQFRSEWNGADAEVLEDTASKVEVDLALLDS